MKQTTGTSKTLGNKIVKNIKWVTCKHYSSDEKIIFLKKVFSTFLFDWLCHVHSQDVAPMDITVLSDE